ncbi:hypothetical protein KM043_008394 [Ampulex compressa]|nr:hypothetical protein KM043_008394 [Ampulex compressa]
MRRREERATAPLTATQCPTGGPFWSPHLQPSGDSPRITCSRPIASSLRAGSHPARISYSRQEGRSLSSATSGRLTTATLLGGLRASLSHSAALVACTSRCTPSMYFCYPSSTEDPAKSRLPLT